ncbi:MAG: SIS domain-containing protein, partial [Flavobacteriales bacterium]|nr:SIS domain-containing protein [Flavobacteriales bacterium]
MLNVPLLPHTLEDMSTARTHFREALSLLSNLIEDEAFISSVDSASKALSSCLQSGGKILSCGNGGSMSDAMHFAEELSGKFR